MLSKPLLITTDLKADSSKESLGSPFVGAMSKRKRGLPKYGCAEGDVFRERSGPELPSSVVLRPMKLRVVPDAVPDPTNRNRPSKKAKGSFRIGGILIGIVMTVI